MAVRDMSVQIIIAAEVKKALDAFDSAGKAIHKFSVQTEQIGRAIDGVFSPLMRGLTTAVTAIGAGMGMLAKSALTVGGDFELTMKRVGGVTTATSEQFDEMTAKARKLGEELPISAQQAAEAMYSLSSAGMTAKETLEAIDAVTGLSIAQNYDLAQSANLMTATLRGFGLAASDSGRVADVFNNVIASSMLNMEKLGEAITYVAPVAKSLGISIEETAAAMGKLADSGLRGEQIGTALRAVMLQLIDPTAEAAAELQRLGVTVTDTTGKLRPLDQIFTDLKVSGMTAAEAVRIFDRRSVAAALTLSEVSGELKQYSEELGKLGRTQKLVADMMDTFKNKAEAVRSALQETLLVVFDQIQEQSKGVADELVKLVKVFNDWAKETQVFRKVIDALFEGFGLVTGNVELFAQALKSIDVDMIAGQFKSFAEGVKAAYNAFMDFAEKVPWGFLAEHLDKIALTIVTGWAAGKFLLITAALGKLAAVIVSLSKALYGLAAAQTAASGGFLFSAATGTSLAAFGAGLAGALGLITAFPEALADNADNAKLWQEAIDGNAEALAKLSKEEQAFIQQNYLVKKATTDTSEAFDETGKKVGESLTEMVRKVVDTYSDETVRVNQLVALFSTQITDAMKVSGGVEAFIGQFAKMEPELQNLMSKVVATVQAGAVDIGKAGEVTNAFSESVSEGVKKALDQYVAFADETSQKIKELVDSNQISMEDGMIALQSSLKAKGEALSNDLAKTFDNPAVKQIFINSLDQLGKAGGDVLTQQIAASLKGVETQLSNFSDRAKAILTEVMEGFNKFGTATGYVVQESADYAVVVASDGVNTLLQVHDKATGEIVASGNRVAEALRGAGKKGTDVFNEIAEKSSWTAQLVKTAWEKDAIKPLEKTGETARKTGESLSGVAAEAVKVADGFKDAISGIDAAISTMGERMVSALSVAVEGLKIVFEQIGIDSGNSMMTALNRQVEAAIPSLSTTAANAGMSMGQSMGRSLETAMQTSLQNIARAIDAMARRAAATVPAAAGSGGNVDAAALAAAYAREG